MEVSLTDRIRVSEDVMFRELDGEAVLLNLKNEMYYGLDDVGTRCWTHLAASPTIEQACDKVSTEYGVELGRARADVIDLVANLLQQGLIEVDNGDVE